MRIQYCANEQERAMHATTLRQHYRPARFRAPAWMLRLWHWL